MKNNWITIENFLVKVKMHLANINDKKYVKHILKNGNPIDKHLIILFLHMDEMNIINIADMLGSRAKYGIGKMESTAEKRLIKLLIELDIVRKINRFLFLVNPSLVQYNKTSLIGQITGNYSKKLYKTLNIFHENKF